MVAVADDERERRAERAAVAEAGEHLDLVRLDLLARRAAVALLAPAEVGVDRVLVEDEPAGRPETIATSAGPCDSPAVASSSVMAESLEPREDPRDEALVPVPLVAARRKRASRPDSCGSSEIAACLLAAPDAEARVLRLRR